MIRGILLKHQPEMRDWEEIEILSLLDPLLETEYLKEVSKVTGQAIERRVFENSEITITMFTTLDPIGGSAMEGIWKILEEAAPDLVKVFRTIDKKIIVAWPRYPDDLEENENYERMMDELIRVGVFLLRTFGLPERNRIVELLRDYVETCVSIKEE